MDNRRDTAQPCKHTGILLWKKEGGVFGKVPPVLVLQAHTVYTQKYDPLASGESTDPSQIAELLENHRSIFINLEPFAL